VTEQQRTPIPLAVSCQLTFPLLLVAAVGLPSATRAEPPPVEFNRDIRPILSDTCFQCHGPDQARRKAGLRFDTEEGAFGDLGGRHAIVPGDLAKSELYRRITATDESERMPPVKSGRKLNARQIDLLRRWIEQGAKWQKHWAFLPPVRPPLPAVTNTAWVRNAIDSFILARLESEGLGPSPEAERTTLLRRATLDLTGLPPTPAEVDAFLADNSPDAYEKVVDRLLSSPRYGERVAVRWLDAARYADTSGYQSDGERQMWRWRDWVIDAYNRNLPFDRFTVEQLAGDLLPGATLEQKIATGFNRNHRGNGEGGIVPEEYAVEYVVDRVETTATVWLGLTMGCARCHDHKFDPIRQKEFYQVFAYFNNVPEQGRAIKIGNSPPYIKSPTAAQQQRLDELELQLASAEERFRSLEAEIAPAQAKWERSLTSVRSVSWSITDGLQAHYPLDGQLGDRTGKGPEAKFQDGEPSFLPGRLGRAAQFDGRRSVEAGNVADFGFFDKFSLAAWVRPEAGGGVLLSRMKDVAQGAGYHVAVEAGKVQLNLVVRWLDDALRVETEEALTPGCRHHVLVSYDGSRAASGVRIYVDGKPQKLRVLLDELNQTFQTKEPFRIGAGGGPEGRFRGEVEDVRVYNRVLEPDEAAVVATAESVSTLAALPAEKRSPPQIQKMRACFLDTEAPEPVRRARRELIELRRRRAAFVESLPTTMVMEEMPTPRETHVLLRGVYDRRGEKVTPAVPASLPPLPLGVANNRLGFARWLVDPSNPLTARVAVNRSWQMYFGTGLVKTLEDFGSQGEWPTHPDLLDWLATEFVRGGWDVKALQRLIVTSATYRQSSRVTKPLLQKDPENRLLARGPRLRLSAEVIRDQALSVSGLLVEQVGGPSVRPYQPEGLVKELTGTEDYKQDHGPSLYRRSLYTFWKRTVAPPAMLTFDAAGRETCVVRETRTNTPLQALTLLNDVAFVEAARVLAQRVMMEGGATPEESLTFAFRLATGRRPRPAELRVLLDGFHEHLAHYRKDKQAALKLVNTGEFRRDEKLDVSELAAYTAVAGLILNLDEMITKE
jgi:mono/diheme cytochrome c family protein